MSPYAEAKKIRSEAVSYQPGIIIGNPDRFRILPICTRDASIYLQHLNYLLGSFPPLLEASSIMDLRTPSPNIYTFSSTLGLPSASCSLMQSPFNLKTYTVPHFRRSHPALLRDLKAVYPLDHPRSHSQRTTMVISVPRAVVLDRSFPEPPRVQRSTFNVQYESSTISPHQEHVSSVSQCLLPRIYLFI